jgi:predicted dehydrogenase
MNRRTFMQATAAGLTVPALTSYTQELAGGKPKRVGLIGTGWYGKVDLLRLIQISPVEVVGLCDVDSKMLKEAGEIVASRQKSGKTPHLFSDYREMLKKEQFDIVLVGTPDHWHALNMIEAVKAGADVYCQKPTGVDVVESQAMLAAARKYGRVVQIGTQRRSTPHLIDARNKVIQEGLLGKISHAEICCYYHMRSRQNPADTVAPDHFDYDMWTGPAPMRPYNPLVHPRSWRAFMEYSNGIVGDMCVHMLDMVRWMLDLGWPKRISSSGGILMDKASKANTTDTQTATFDFGDLNVVWTHRSWGNAPDPEYPWAAFIYGEKGTLKASVNKFEFIPRGKGTPVTGEALFEYDKYPEDRTEKDLERHVASAVRGHMLDLLESVADRSKPVADIEQGYISSASCIMANIAMELGRTLEWDSRSGRVINDDEANELLRRPYRNPWVHPEVDSL